MNFTTDELLMVGKNRGASDVHLSVASKPLIRVDGELVILEEYPVLTPEMVYELIRQVLPEEAIIKLEHNGEVDVSFGRREIGRLRANAFRQRGTYALVMRLIPVHIGTFEEYGLPSILTQLSMKNKGLVLVTGPTGSGKSTTLAAMINYINQRRRCHIVTLEDPIEFLHKHGTAVVNQREVGYDTKTFATGLRSALREDPDVILVGEMRDLETTQTAIQAAETGHLVLATLHTNDCTQTVDRIIDIFPPHQQHQVRSQLSLALEGILSQILVPRAGGRGRTVAIEILIATPAIRNLIREAKTHQIYSVIETGSRMGMQTMDGALRDLVRHGQITMEDGLNRSLRPEEFRKFMHSGGQTARG